MIEYLYANNYKTLVNFEVKFNKTNVLIGKSGAGKSTVLFLLGCLRDFMAGTVNITECFPNFSKTVWYGSAVQTFEIGYLRDGKHFTYHLEIDHSENEQNCTVKYESVKYENTIILEEKNGKAELYNDDFELSNSIQADMSRSGLNFVFAGNGNKKLSEFKNEAVGNVIICEPNPKNMIVFSSNGIDNAFPDSSFSNIISVYAYLSQAHPEVIYKLWEQLREINPAFVQTNAKITQYGKTMYTSYNVGEESSAFSFNLMQLSDGERKLLALYLLLYAYLENGMTVLIDEPENYLGLREVQPWCAEVDMICNENENGGQCIFASHHPETIDYYANNSAIWMSRINSGESKIAMNNPLIFAEDDSLMKYSELIAKGYWNEAQ